MVSVLGSCEGEDGRREEHGFVVGMRNQEADTLVLDGRLGSAGSEHVDARHHNGKAGKDVKNVHVGGGFSDEVIAVFCDGCSGVVAIDLRLGSSVGWMDI